MIITWGYEAKLWKLNCDLYKCKYSREEVGFLCVYQKLWNSFSFLDSHLYEWVCSDEIGESACVWVCHRKEKRRLANFTPLFIGGAVNMLLLLLLLASTVSCVLPLMTGSWEMTLFFSFCWPFHKCFCVCLQVDGQNLRVSGQKTKNECVCEVNSTLWSFPALQYEDVLLKVQICERSLNNLQEKVGA